MSEFSLTEVIPDISTVNVADIGAMSLGEGTEPYAPLLRIDKVKVIGFEPNEEECEKLRGLHSKTHEFYPYFIGDGGAAIYHETNYPMTGSLYPPNTKLVKLFHNLNELMKLQKKHPVETSRSRPTRRAHGRHVGAARGDARHGHGLDRGDLVRAAPALP